MKRLAYFLRNMDQDTHTYPEMYDAELFVVDPERAAPDKCFDPIYYNEDIGFKITGTHKLAQDKPTVTINIPIEKLSMEEDTLQSHTSAIAAADHCLRKFAPYIDGLNAELYNRSRPDSENGKYYLYRPGGEVLYRNTAYFALCPQRDYDYLSKNKVILLDDGITRRPKMCLCIRMLVQLPKRKIRRTLRMLCRDLPDAVDRFITEFDPMSFEEALKLAEKQNAVRSWLKNSDYCAFIANGSILPRAKGTDLPMTDAIPVIVG